MTVAEGGVEEVEVVMTLVVAGAGAVMNLQGVEADGVLVHLEQNPIMRETIRENIQTREMDTIIETVSDLANKLCFGDRLQSLCHRQTSTQ